MEKTFLVDLTRCTACRGCQVACKQWHKLPAEETVNRGSHQNPEDLSFITYKLVRFTETEIDGQLKWLFFPDQCRHCSAAPCKEVADGYIEGTILQDEETGAVLYTARTAELPPEAKEEVREYCPYDIPRLDPVTGQLGKCDMCIDRVHNGMLPACVQVCPTGAMNFGDREDMLALAEERLAAVRAKKPRATLVDVSDVNVIYLTEEDPLAYYKHATVADASPRTYTRKQMLAKFMPRRRARA